MDSYYPTYCDDGCGTLLGYMTYHPRGYMICEACHTKQMQQDNSTELESEVE